jgi:hypothetical protein
MLKLQRRTRRTTSLYKQRPPRHSGVVRGRPLVITWLPRNWGLVSPAIAEINRRKAGEAAVDLSKELDRSGLLSWDRKQGRTGPPHERDLSGSQRRELENTFVKELDCRGSRRAERPPARVAACALRILQRLPRGRVIDALRVVHCGSSKAEERIGVPNSEFRNLDFRNQRLKAIMRFERGGERNLSWPFFVGRVALPVLMARVTVRGERVVAAGGDDVVAHRPRGTCLTYRFFRRRARPAR